MLRVGNEWKSQQKTCFGKYKFGRFFFRTVNQLKKTSDCIKIDPPGPGQHFEKVKKVLKKKKKKIEILDPFFDFF